jgi:YVTN family beta-propeller protein
VDQVLGFLTDSTKVICSNYYSGSASVISTGSNAVISTVTGLTEPGGVVVTPYEFFYEVEAARDAWLSPASLSATLPLGWNTGGWQ